MLKIKCFNKNRTALSGVGWVAGAILTIIAALLIFGLIGKMMNLF